MLHITQEEMSEAMLKVHLGEGLVVHRFSAPDFGFHHDHPWPFLSTIIRGGYLEEIMHRDGSLELVERLPGNQFLITPNHIHRIVRLFDDVVWTCIDLQGEKTKEPGFYEIRDGVIWSRRWFEKDFTLHTWED